MCGVGPLAIRAAKNKGCNVFANDLNPSCFEFLQKNIRENHLSHKIQSFNMCGREFIRKIVSKEFSDS